MAKFPVNYLPPQGEPEPFQQYVNDKRLPSKGSLYQKLAENYREERGSVTATMTRRMLQLRTAVARLLEEENTD